MNNTSWRCLDSPNAAHHWIVSDDGTFQDCKYCFEHRQLRTQAPIQQLDIQPWEFYEIVS